jgi:hypothetical protein
LALSSAGIPVCRGDKQYFLQARLMLLSVLDTRGWEEFFHIQGAGSKVGCLLCRHMRGRHSEKLRKTIYGEQRKGLPMTHIWTSKTMLPRRRV